jgi:hypothetical protein
MAVYYASKAYVLSFSEAVSRELKNTGVTVTAVCPGPTNTEFNKKANFGTSGFIFNKHSASAKSVAVFSYKKMKKGKAVAVPGFFNKIASVGVRLLPKRIVRNMVYWLQKKRSK